MAGAVAGLRCTIIVRPSTMARRRERKRMGRPPEFRARVRLVVLLEAVELRALHRVAETAGVSASAYVRRLIQGALRRAGGPWWRLRSKSALDGPETRSTCAARRA